MIEKLIVLSKLKRLGIKWVFTLLRTQKTKTKTVSNYIDPTIYVTDGRQNRGSVRIYSVLLLGPLSGHSEEPGLLGLQGYVQKKEE